MQFLFDPVWPWWCWALCALALPVLVVIAYRRRLAYLPAWLRRTLLTLRLVALVVLLFAMLRPVVEFTEVDQQGTVLAILADSSRSMGVKDGSAGATRRDTLLALLEGAEADLKRLGTAIEIRLFDFDTQLRPVDKFGREAEGEQSAYGQVLEELARQSQSRRVALAVLIGDGAQRALPPFDLDARVAARRLGDEHIPVHTLGVGSSGLADTTLDLAVQELDMSPTVFEKNTVVVSGKIRATGVGRRELTVRLLLEDPTSAEPGKPTAMKPVTAPLKLRTEIDSSIVPFEMTFLAPTAGEYRLAVEAVPIEGEPVVVNNTQTTFLSVIKGGVSVAYFDTVRPEQKFVRLINESPDIQLDFKPVRLGEFAKKSTIEPDWFTPGRYDVYIVGDVPAEVFGTKLLPQLARAVQQGAGLMMTGGLRSFGPGGYAETPLADLLPVKMLASEIAQGDSPSPDLHVLEDLKMLPTNQGLQAFVMRLDSPDKNADRWKKLPALAGANKFTRLQDLAKILATGTATGREPVPLLVSLEVGRARSLAFAGDTTYQWALAGELPAHQRFWQQCVLWLARKDEQGADSVWVKLDSRRVRVGQPLSMTLGARDGDKRPVTDAAFTVEVRGPGDTKWQLNPQKLGDDFSALFSEAKLPGEYRVSVQARKDGVLLPGGAVARFLVYEEDLELHNPAADFGLLDEISRMTGGRVIPPDQFGAFLKDLLAKPELLNPEVKRVTRLSLWDNWSLMGLFVCLLVLEWFIRKRHGLV